MTAVRASLVIAAIAALAAPAHGDARRGAKKPAKPAAGKPAADKPGGDKPAATGDTKPGDTKPAGDKPGDARPAGDIADLRPDPPPGSSDPKVAHADQLFAEGKALMDSSLLQACDKFDQSLRENPAAMGTLLNVALCDEKLGRVASAFARFAEARDRAKEQNLPEHQRAAEDHLAVLEPLVPHLTIALAEPLPELTVLIDDRVIPPGQLTEVAVDPGERVIVVSAPARLPYRTRLTIARSAHARLVVPALERSITVTSSRRRIGQITTLVGVAALGTAAGLGLYANHLFDQQFDRHCTHQGGRDFCDATGLRNTERASSLGNVGTVVGIAGVAAVGVGLYLWIRSPSSTEPRPALAVVPQLAADGVGLAALGRF